MVSPVFSVQTLHFKVDVGKTLMEELQLINAEGIIESANHPFAPPNEITDGGRGISGCWSHWVTGQWKTF